MRCCRQSGSPDPHSYFAVLREHDPVHWNEKYRAWFIHRYHDVLDALRDPRFSSERIGPAYDRLTDEQKAQRQPTYDILMDWLVFRDPTRPHPAAAVGESGLHPPSGGGVARSDHRRGR